MPVDRMKRVNELIRREIGEAIFNVINDEMFDKAAVTVTHVITSRNLRTAKVLISIRDHKNERNSMLSLLKKHRVEIQQIINQNLQLKFTPRLSFLLDDSVEKGDHILDILNKIEPLPEMDAGDFPEPNEDISDA